MNIKLSNISKNFENHRVLNNFSFEFRSGNQYAVLGANGSGKSTLIKILSGSLTPTSGNIKYDLDGKDISHSEIYKHVCIASPWCDPIEEFTLEELIHFHFKFKKLKNGIKINDIPEISGLSTSLKKDFHHFSSGMKQRVRLTLAILSSSDILLLDEPLANLDASGTLWYRELIAKFVNSQTMIVASNHQNDEYDFCSEVVELT